MVGCDSSWIHFVTIFSFRKHRIYCTRFKSVPGSAKNVLSLFQANLISSVDHGSNSLLVFCCQTRLTNLKHLNCISKIPKFNICTRIYLFKICNITYICVNFYIHLVHAALLKVINSLVCLHETIKKDVRLVILSSL